jgi:hypothetical protein
LRRKIGIARRRAALALTGAVLAQTGLAAAEEADDLATFVAAHRCDVVRRLEMIHANGAPPDRFLIIELQGPGGAYVQCLFGDDDHQLFCEGESGFYDHPPGAPQEFHLGSEGVRALAKLGFSTDASKGNYQRMFDVAGPQDYSRVAEIILDVLFEAYGARLDSQLAWHAPLVPGTGRLRDCAPVS